VNLVGDTSNLGPTIYYAIAGGTGDGSPNNPGDVAGAGAANAQYIVLLNNPAGGQDTIDATLALDPGQSLLGFRDTDTFNLAGSLPANVILYNISNVVTNPYAGSGAPILTSTAFPPGTLLSLASNTTVDGVIIKGGVIGVANGADLLNVTIRNSTISDLNIQDSTNNVSAGLSNLALGSLWLDGRNPGTFTVTDFSNLTVNRGAARIDGAIFDADPNTAGYQTINGGSLQIGSSGSPVADRGLFILDANGALSFANLNIYTNGGSGLLVSNTAANNFTLSSLGGTISTVGTAAFPTPTAIGISNATLNLNLASVSMANGTNAIRLNNVQGNLAVAGAVTGTNLNGYGVDLTNTTGAISLGSLSTTATGASSGVLNVNNSSATTGNLGLTIGGGGTSSSAGVAPIAITNGGSGTINLNVAMASLSTSSPTIYGIRIDNNSTGAITGSVNIAGGSLTTTTNGIEMLKNGVDLTYGGSITANSGHSVSISGSSGTINLSGNITDNGIGISLINNTGGSVTFSGASKILNTGSAIAFFMSGNSAGFGASFTNGGLQITTTTGNGLYAAGSGTLCVTGTGNTITATGGGTPLFIGSSIVVPAGCNQYTTSP
jgi:hypothetical protein